jgi:DNA-binding response OmpR family regulator
MTGAKMMHAPDHAALPNKRILIVEDDDCLYQALRDSLQDAGCEVFGSCERVCDPLDTVPASRLDAALVDMDPLGSDRAASLAHQLNERHVPIVWITSRRNSGPAPALPTQEWLCKPFTERELLDSIAGAVGGIGSRVPASQESAR